SALLRPGFVASVIRREERTLRIKGQLDLATRSELLRNLALHHENTVLVGAKQIRGQRNSHASERGLATWPARWLPDQASVRAQLDVGEQFGGDVEQVQVREADALQIFNLRVYLSQRQKEILLPQVGPSFIGDRRSVRLLQLYIEYRLFRTVGVFGAALAR